MERKKGRVHKERHRCCFYNDDDDDDDADDEGEEEVEDNDENDNEDVCYSHNCEERMVEEKVKRG